MREAEDQMIAEALNGIAGYSPKPLFIVGSPRTGSTICYQASIEYFGFQYFSNVVNSHFSTTPLLGLLLHSGRRGIKELSFTSAFGKTSGLFAPSEASAVMANWFGGGHPSQTVSATVLPGKAGHLHAVMAAAEILVGTPVVTKNAWNCFRISSIAEALPEARFLWIRRDIAASAKSDLHARYVVQGTPDVWNSATPANVDALRRKPYWEQVVENQFEFAQAISAAGSRLASERFTEVWYEDLCGDPEGELAAAGMRLGYPVEGKRLPAGFSIAPSRDAARLSPDDAAAIDRYVLQHKQRFDPLRREPASGS
ncbi:sulfotransferase [Caenispirillum bisanense]|uniref:sulfotransferase n=1 Tax=Caenispirillum bisanense TaxID=414052 RepID=UPI0031D42241